MDWIYSEVFRVQDALGAGSADLNDILAEIALEFVMVTQGYGSGGHSPSDIQTAILSLSDVEALACAMITYLQDKDVSYDNFTHAIDSFSPANANQTLLADLVSLAIIHYDAFNDFIGNMELENQLALALNPTSYDCPACGSIGAYCSTSETWDFTLGQKIPWFVYRGAGKVTFDPEQVKPWEDTRAGANSPWAPVWVAPEMPADGKVVAHATFSEPGTYILRGLADDGALFGSDDVTVTVRP